MKYSIKYILFAISNIVIWLPSDILPYLMPLCIGLIIVMNKINIYINKIIYFLLFIISLFIIYNALYGYYSNVNALLTLVTYSSLIFLILINNRDICESEEKKYTKFIVYMLVIQASIGFVQFIYAYIQGGGFTPSMGDFVEGTSDIYLSGARGLETQVFFANQTYYLLWLSREKYRQKYKIPIILGVISIILSSVIHMLFFLTISLAISIFYVNNLYEVFKKKYTKHVILALISMFILLFVYQPENIYRIKYNIQRMLVANSPKAVMIEKYFSEIIYEYPQSAFWGLGNGQYSSRVSLINTGLYTNSTVLTDDPIISPPMQKYFMNTWNHIRSLPVASSNLFPFYSWLSVLTEFGIILTFIFINWIYRNIKRIKNFNKITMENQVILISLILFLFFIGFQDNYWETPQIVFLGIYILKYMLGKFRYNSKKYFLVKYATD